jgi:hypothetical protein
VATPGRTRIAVRISHDVWLEEVERLRAGSPARVAAERERARLESEGVELGQLRACKDEAEDRTRLEGGAFGVRSESRDRAALGTIASSGAFVSWAGP